MGKPQDVGAILARLGYYYRREGRYVKAVDLSLAAVEWYDKHPGIATDGMIRAYADLAALYSTLALTEKALDINARVIRMAAVKTAWRCAGPIVCVLLFLWIWNRLFGCFLSG